MQAPALEEEDAAGMCYTSGTTGKPKGVVYSHRALVLHSLACAMGDTLGLKQADSVCPVVPMFHVNAWGLPFTGAMVGCKLVLPGPHLDALSLLDLYQSEKVTFTAGVPTIWVGILQALEKNPAQWKLDAWHAHGRRRCRGPRVDDPRVRPLRSPRAARVGHDRNDAARDHGASETRAGRIAGGRTLCLSLPSRACRRRLSKCVR